MTVINSLIEIFIIDKLAKIESKFLKNTKFVKLIYFFANGSLDIRVCYIYD